jgi:histidine triad (HIT) family protein
MAYSYDDQNIFAKILRGEIPNTTVHETEHTLAFRDINPVAPTHVLVIPKGAYVCFDQFASEATEDEIVDFMRVAGKICADEGLQEGGYRTIANAGLNGVQDVPHYHLHLIGGRPLGPMISREG